MGLDIFGIGDVAGAAATYAGTKYTADMNYRIWHEQRDWNTPAAQMQRYREAGLNPNLIYGNVESGNITNTPNMPNFGEVGGKIGEAVKKMNSLAYRAQVAEVKKAEAEAKTAEATTDNVNADTAVKMADQLSKDNANKEYGMFGYATAYYNLSNIIADYRNKIASGKLTEAQRKQISADLDMLEVKKAKMYKEMLMLDKDIEKKGVDIGLARQQMLYNVFDMPMNLEKSELDLTRKRLYNEVPYKYPEFLFYGGQGIKEFLGSRKKPNRSW